MSVKTNAMRILDKAKISYETFEYNCDDGNIDGVSVAQKLNQPVDHVYKTLVTKGGNDYFVFVLPVACELDLKAAAKAVEQKAVGMIKVADINKVTGYIRGGCSPIGMKKQYQTVMDASCEGLPFLIFSGGKIGHQIKMKPQDLLALIGAKTASIVMGEQA